MLNTLAKMINGFIDDSLRALRKRPLEVGIGLVVAFYLSTLIEGMASTSGETEIRFLLTASIIWIGIFGVSSLYYVKALGRKERLWITTAVIVLGIGFAMISDFSLMSTGWQWATVMTACIVGVTLVPLAVRRAVVPQHVRFWRFVARLLVRAIVCAVFVGCLYTGVALGILAMQVLFEISGIEEIYAHLWVWTTVGLGTWMFLAGQKDVIDVDKPIIEGAVRWIARLGTWLVLPLVGFYLFIMYVYAARILFTDFAPSNVISPLVLGAGVLVFIGLFLVTPLRHRESYDLLARTFAGIPALFLPPLMLAAWAILERVGQYGWTEFRYLRMLAVFCMAVVCVYALMQWLRKDKIELYVVPAVVAVAFALASMGPGSMTQISQKSQINRIVSAADEAGILLADGTFEAERVSELTHTVDLISALRYLHQTHGEESYQHLVPEGVEAPLDWYHDVTRQPLTGPALSSVADQVRYNQGGYGKAIPTPGSQPMRLTAPAPHSISRTGDLISMRYINDQNVLSLAEKSLRVTFDGLSIRWSDDGELLLQSSLDELPNNIYTESELDEQFRAIAVYDGSGDKVVGELVLEALRIREVDEELEIEQIEQGWLILDQMP